MTDERLPEEIEHAIDQVRYCGGQEWSIHNLRRAIFSGMQASFEDGLREYAWWKDGMEYVGSCGTTLKEAIERARAKAIREGR